MNTKICLICKKVFEKHYFYSRKYWITQKYCSKKCYGVSNKGKSTWNKGIPNYEMRGEKNSNWKGGVTPIYKKIRESFEYEEWRTKVFERDLYTCQFCGQIGGYLNADHIKSFASYPDLRFELSNGRTLCVPCHKKTFTYGFKGIPRSERKEFKYNFAAGTQI